MSARVSLQTRHPCPGLSARGSSSKGHPCPKPEDTVRIDKEGFGRRRRTAVLTTARHDGRLKAQIRNGQSINVMASKVTRIHRTLEARVQ